MVHCGQAFLWSCLAKILSPVLGWSFLPLEIWEIFHYDFIQYIFYAFVLFSAPTPALWHLRFGLFDHFLEFLELVVMLVHSLSLLMSALFPCLSSLLGLHLLRRVHCHTFCCSFKNPIHWIFYFQYFSFFKFSYAFFSLSFFSGVVDCIVGLHSLVLDEYSYFIQMLFCVLIGIIDHFCKQTLEFWIRHYTHSDIFESVVDKLRYLGRIILPYIFHVSLWWILCFCSCSYVSQLY